MAKTTRVGNIDLTTFCGPAGGDRWRLQITLPCGAFYVMKRNEVRDLAMLIQQLRNEAPAPPPECIIDGCGAHRTHGFLCDEHMETS
jgi:hypothetical protein